jgi:SAM-dependent methyltransferase
MHNPLAIYSTLDTSAKKRQLREALVEKIPLFHGTFLDVGCGRMPYKDVIMAPPGRVREYIGLDLGSEKYGQPDLVWDGRNIPLAPQSVDCAMATEVLEHCPEPELLLREVVRVLKPGGTFFFTVPFLWPLHDAPYDEYRYTPFALRRHLVNSGFGNVQMKALGGWDASLGIMLGLWVRRSPMGKLRRRLLSILLAPVIGHLHRRDCAPPVDTDQTMLVGIAGTCNKA